MWTRGIAAIAALFVFSASSWAPLCAASCAFAQVPSAPQTMPPATSSASTDTNMDMAGMPMGDHLCCPHASNQPALSALHHRMSPDCAELSSSGSPLLNASAQMIHVVAHPAQAASGSLAAGWVAETPPVARTGLALSRSPALPLLSVLRI